MSNNQNNMKFHDLQKELRGLEFKELLNLYLEAKTGKYLTPEDLLPAEILEAIEALKDALEEAIEGAAS